MTGPAGRPARQVHGLVLAAGSGTRFGGPKALVDYDGEPLVRRAVRLLQEGGCDGVTVVLGAQADRARDALAPLAVEVVVATDWASGMGASLRAGLAALPARAGACVVALVDTPLVGPGAVPLLRAAWGRGAVAAVATYGGARRNPVLLDRSVWSGVSALAEGDTGARAWLRAHPDLVTDVPCDATGAPDDVDTPEDLHALLPALSRTTDARTTDPRRNSA